LGVTPSAWAASRKAIQVGTGEGVFASAGTYGFFGTNCYLNSSGSNIRVNSGYAQEYRQWNDGSHQWMITGTSTAGSSITFTQAMTLDASGNLGVGTTTYSSKLNITGGSLAVSGTGLSVSTDLATGRLVTSTTTPYRISAVHSYFDDQTLELSQGSTSGYVSGIVIAARSAASSAPDSVTFWTRSAERARIDSSGNLLVGTTSQISSGFMCLSFANNVRNGIVINDTDTGSGTSAAIIFRRNGSQVGSIVTTTSTTALVGTSDYRLKNSIKPMVGALQKVIALKPCTYKWNVDGSDGEGFIAHELQAVVPDAVVGEKDAVNEDGSIKAQGINTNFLIATLTAAIQELKAEFDAYKSTHP
jgi:hypothetical protein